MKRFLCLLLAIVLLVSASGCGKSAMPLDYQLKDEIAKAAKGYKLDSSVLITSTGGSKCTVTIKADVNKWEFAEIVSAVTPVVRNFLGKNDIGLQWLWYDSEKDIHWHSSDGKVGSFEDKEASVVKSMTVQEVCDYCGYSK